MTPRQTWSEVTAWRKLARARLLAERCALSRPARERIATAIALALRRHAPEDMWPSVGFYWPIKAEPDLRPLVRELIEQGAEAALPVVVVSNAPLEFWRWNRLTKLTRQSVWPESKAPKTLTQQRAPTIWSAWLGQLWSFACGQANYSVRVMLNSMEPLFHVSPPSFVKSMV